MIWLTKKFLKFCDKKKFSNEFIEHSKARKNLIDTALETLIEINRTVYDILYHDLPKSIRSQKDTMDALAREMCCSYTLGYIIEQAIADGWLKYDDNTSAAIGAYINIE